MNQRNTIYCHMSLSFPPTMARFQVVNTGLTMVIMAIMFLMTAPTRLASLLSVGPLAFVLTLVILLSVVSLLALVGFLVTFVVLMVTLMGFVVLLVTFMSFVVLLVTIMGFVILLVTFVDLVILLVTFMGVVVLMVTFVGFMVFLVTFVVFITLLVVFMGLVVSFMALLGLLVLVTLMVLVVAGPATLFPLLPFVAFSALRVSITVSVFSSGSPLMTLDVTFFVVLDTLFLMFIFVVVVCVFSSLWIFCCGEGHQGIICKCTAVDV